MGNSRGLREPYDERPAGTMRHCGARLDSNAMARWGTNLSGGGAPLTTG